MRFWGSVPSLGLVNAKAEVQTFNLALLWFQEITDTKLD